MTKVSEFLIKLSGMSYCVYQRTMRCNFNEKIDPQPSTINFVHTALCATISPRKYCTVSDEIEGVLAHLNYPIILSDEKKNSVDRVDVREK